MVSTHSRPKAAGTAVQRILYTMFKFQHTAARRRLAHNHLYDGVGCQFQHTAARRRLGRATATPLRAFRFQHTAARRRLDPALVYALSPVLHVSTHSRPKAAGTVSCVSRCRIRLFQHTAARRRLVGDAGLERLSDWVSTHSRPKAAGRHLLLFYQLGEVSTHSRPKAAG